jgi:nitrogen fixation NifU-like protein
VRGHARVDQTGGLVEAYFDGAGCVISLAAASILMEAVEGKTLVEIKAIEYQYIPRFGHFYKPFVFNEV